MTERERKKKWKIDPHSAMILPVNSASNRVTRKSQKFPHYHKDLKPQNLLNTRTPPKLENSGTTSKTAWRRFNISASLKS